ncbi:YtfJ family protein [Polyangium sp. y55x31]|uniref:YtfJ family protein n=1 Tax=Polyangium sp. y55x31 TaxID=3042688 RepID=UPI002482481F|nr:YtfJ family protein [Polyangium sp. y55x31]MDI1478386.1 YtfJ family protein [Polyangium sp. y55x31]
MKQAFVRKIRVSPLILGKVFLVLLLLLPAGSALALPGVGQSARRVVVEDPDGRAMDLAFPREKPTLILYEDRKSATQNQALKEELNRLAATKAEAKQIQFVAIADTSDYRGWPLRGFAERSVRKKSAEVGQIIYCDWEGKFRKAYNLRRGVSTVLLVGKDGRVEYAAEGKLDAPARSKLLALLWAQVR